MTNCFNAHERVGVHFPSLLCNSGNKHQNNTRVSAGTVRHESIYIILFLTRHNESINDDKNDDLCTTSSCLTGSIFVLLITSQSIVDDVTMTRHLWPDHVNRDIDLLDIDFVHGDIHGGSCKKVSFLLMAWWHTFNDIQAGHICHYDCDVQGPSLVCVSVFFCCPPLNS